MYSFLTAIQAQIFVDKVNVNAKSIAYLEVWEKFDEDRGSYVAMVDFGQKDDRKADKHGAKLRITNEKGAVIDFNGVIHILNYLDKQGWEVLHVKSLGKFHSYIMHRKEPNSFELSRANN